MSLTSFANCPPKERGEGGTAPYRVGPPFTVIRLSLENIRQGEFCMKSSKLFTVLSGLAAVVMFMSSGTAYSQSGTPAPTAAGTTAAAEPPYCTPDMAMANQAK